MRRITIDCLTLLVGGTRLEREREMGDFQSTCNFVAELTKSIRTREADRLMEHWSSAPTFMLSEVQEIDGKQATERVLLEIISRRRRVGLPTTLGMDTVPAFWEKAVFGPSPDISKPEYTEEELFDAAVETAFEEGYITVAMLQCHFNLGYKRTMRLIDKMETLGIISAPNDPMPRQLRMPRTKWEEIRKSHLAGRSVYGQRQDDFQIKNGCLTKYKGGGGDVVLPEGIEEIGPDAFIQSTGLTGIYIPDGVAKIGVSAFLGCINLKRVSLPVETIQEIGLFAFLNCADLTEFQIPWNVTKIKGGTFDHCTSLKNIVIPDLVIDISENPFIGCTNLTSIHVMPGNNVFSAQGGALFRDDGKELVCCPAASEEYHIPESVVRIGPHAFCECRDLTGIIIPEGVKEIGVNAFCSCTGLTEVTIPSSVEEVGGGAFDGCENLASLTIRDGVKKIGTCAFDRTGVTGSLRDFLPKSVMELGAHVFPFYCCGGGKRRPGTDRFID